MQTISYVIVEDDPSCLIDLQHILKSLSYPLDFKGHAASVSDAIRLINEQKPQLVFMDVELNNDVSFSILEQLHVIPDIIFVTAHAHYALKAIKSSAFDYLLKPVDPIELRTALSRYQLSKKRSELPEVHLEQQRTQLLSYQNPTKKTERILVKQTGRMIIIQINEICAVEGEGNYTRFHMNNGSKIMTSLLLKDVEELLDETSFIRCHKSFCVNLDEISEVRTVTETTILMRSGLEVPVARRRLKEVTDALEFRN